MNDESSKKSSRGADFGERKFGRMMRERVCLLK